METLLMERRSLLRVRRALNNEELRAVSLALKEGGGRAEDPLQLRAQRR